VQFNTNFEISRIN